MSQTFEELSNKAVAVRAHYDELRKKEGKELWNVQDRMAGFVGDVGDLSKLIMAKHNLRREPKDVDEALSHELSDCLWSIMVVADELNIDLEQAFIKSVDALHERIEREKAEVA